MPNIAVARSPQPAFDPTTDTSWHNALHDLPREHTFEPLRVEGTLPADLRGTMYRNGATLLSNHGRRYDHWFDGDGGISAVRFEAGSARGAARVIVSSQLAEERRAGKLMYGGFGTVQPGLFNRLRGKIKNVANTSVMVWNDRLFGLMEAALPMEISTEDLATLGETDFGGVIPRTFSAHPHAVPERNAIYNFGVRYGRKVLLDLFELKHGGRARRIATLPLSGTTMIHDFIATPNHLVFFIPPIRLRVMRMMLGLGGISDNLTWRPELGTEILVVPIDDPTQASRFTVDSFYQWHYANAFERDGDIVVDFIRYPNFDSNEWLTELFRGRSTEAADGTFHRAVINPARRSVDMQQLWDRSCEFPRVAPASDTRDYRYCYVAAHSPEARGRGLQDAIAKLDVTTGTVTEFHLERGRFTSEPVFVPKDGAAAEDDGYVLALIYDSKSHASHCAVFDARAIEAGPLARAHFDHHIPPRFHGVWHA